MNRTNRQILVNPHSSQEKVPVGALNLGEIGVQHNNVEDAALYVETDSASTSASTVAKFITDKAIQKLINSAQTLLESEISSINEAVGLPHDPEIWDSGMSVWDAIEHTYNEMTAGTAAANTKLELVGGEDKYLDLTAVKDDSTSSITYYLSSKGIDERVESAYTIVNNKIDELEERVDDISDELDATNDKLDELSGATEEAIEDLNEKIEELEAEINANEVSSLDGSIVVTPTSGGTDLSVNIDGKSIVLNDNNELVADLKLTSVTPSSVNVREEYALVNHDGARLGETVKIYKDSSLYSAFLGHVDDVLSDPEDPTSVVEGSGDTALDLIYHREDGTYQLVTIDVNDFLEESEFKDGLVVDNHVVKVLVDPNSEELVIGDESGDTVPVLSVSEDGVKVDGIQDAIDYSIEKRLEEIDADVVDYDDYVAVEAVQENAELKQIVVTTKDIASAEAVGLKSDGTFEPNPNSNYASAATSVRNEIQLIDQALKAVSEKLNGAAVVETGSTENWVSLTVEEIEPGKTGITLDDSALAEELIDIRNDIDAEASAREMADAEIIGSSASTSAETSLMGIKKLLDSVAEKISEGVVNDAEFAAVTDKDDSPCGSNAGIAVVDNEGGEGKKIQLDLSTLKIDCGVY